MNTNPSKIALEISQKFKFEGKILNCAPYGSGHINSTFKVETSEKKYILQKVNDFIFKDPVGMMNNILGVTSFLKEKVIKSGKDPDKFSLYVIKTKNGEDYINNELGFWRAYNFIDNAVSLDQIENSSQFYSSGLGFGTFQYLLNDYPAAGLGETIKDFHNTPLRFENFKNIVSENPLDRVKNVKREIEFYMENKDFYSTLVKKQASGILPVRVTHNDTKANNVMLDIKTLEPLCVVDLDTVMPGLSAYDFGDSIRFGASTAAEDEPDIEKVNLSLDYYKAFTDGFCKGLNNSLSKEEISVFPVGAQMMTIECGMRFLTDYIAGDVYFKISREQQNLERSRTQIKLFKEMNRYTNEIEDIVNVYV